MEMLTYVGSPIKKTSQVIQLGRLGRLDPVAQ